MASFSKTKSGWRAQVFKLGVRKSATFDTKKEAQEWAAECEAKIKNGKLFPASVHTLKDALERYAEEVSPKKKGARWEIVRLKKISKEPIAKLKLSDLSSDDFAKWRDKRLKEVKPPSVRREMNVLSGVFKTCINEWGWLKESPLKSVEKPQRAKPRDRRISEREIECVLMSCGYEGRIENKMHLLAVYFLLALETAMRLGELCSVTEKDFYKSQHYVLLNDTKTLIQGKCL